MANDDAVSDFVETNDNGFVTVITGGYGEGGYGEGPYGGTITFVPSTEITVWTDITTP